MTDETAPVDALPNDAQNQPGALVTTPTGQTYRKDTGSDYYSVSEIADLFPVSEKRLYAAIRAGDLPVTKYGRKNLLRIPVVKAWLLTLERPHPVAASDGEGNR